MCCLHNGDQTHLRHRLAASMLLVLLLASAPGSYAVVPIGSVEPKPHQVIANADEETTLTALQEAVSGKRATVRLLHVAYLPKAKVPDPPEAEAGIGLIVLVNPAGDTTGTFGLANPKAKHLMLNGETYDDLTRRKLGHALEPGCVVYNAPEFLRRDAPELTGVAGKQGQEKGAMILQFVFPGVEPPTSGVGTLHLQLGWDLKPEDFYLKFSLAHPPASRNSNASEPAGERGDNPGR